jgi:hypothetical protein
VLGVIGDGGFATVLKARNEAGEPRAIKLLRRGDRVTRERFLREADALVAIGPPHVPALEGLRFLDGGTPYLVMELLREPTLEQLLAATPGPMPLDGFMSCALGITAAVAAVHERGFVHRDLKPENIFVDVASKRTTLIDFGLAKRNGVGAFPRLTIAGVLLGTTEYMSPEQCQGEIEIDHRSDIYSLGVLFYQMLTRELPFRGTPGAVLHGHLDCRPRPPSDFAAVPAALDEIVLRCLAKRPSKRFRDAMEVHRALLEVNSVGRSRTVRNQRETESFEDSLPLTPSTPFVGRDDLVRRLVECGNRALAEPRPHVTTVVGDAGLGKTRVALEAIGQLRAQNREAQVLWLGSGEVQNIAAELTDRARRGPLVCVWDEVDSCDVTTRAALETLIESGEKLPLWILILAQPAIANTLPLHTRFDIEPLTKEESFDLTRQLLAPARVPRLVLRWMTEIAQGVPLLLIEMARFLNREGCANGRLRCASWPPLRAALERGAKSSLGHWLAKAELDSLPPELAAQARLIAVLGTHVAVDEMELVLRELDRRGLGRHFPLDAEASIGRLVERGLLVRDHRGALEFRNPWLRKTIARATPEAQAQALQEAIEGVRLRVAETEPMREKC